MNIGYLSYSLMVACSLSILTLFWSSINDMIFHQNKTVIHKTKSQILITKTEQSVYNFAGKVNSQPGLKTATPTKGLKNYKKEVSEKLAKLYLTDNKDYKITVKITILSTGLVHDVEIIKSPNFKQSEQIVKIFKETSSWFPAKKDGANIDSEVKISVKVQLPVF